MIHLLFLYRSIHDHIGVTQAESSEVQKILGNGGLFWLSYFVLVAAGGGFGGVLVVDEEVAEGVDGVVVEAVFEGQFALAGPAKSRLGGLFAPVQLDGRL